MKSRTDVVAQLGLYTVFHRHPTNRILHATLVPVVMFCGMQLLAYVHGPDFSSQTRFSHLGTWATLFLIACWSTMDAFGALLTGGWLLAQAGLAGWIAASYPAVWVWILDFLVHGAAWYVLLYPAHTHSEPKVEVNGVWEDSNFFLREGLFSLRGAGPEISRLSSFIQIAIAPFAATYDVVWQLGLRKKLEKQVAQYRELVLLRLAQGHAPLTLSGNPREEADKPTPVWKWHGISTLT